MELRDRLKNLKAELATATDLEKINGLTADITRVRRAIMVDAELRSALTPPGTPCGASAAEERARSTMDAEQWQWEAEFRAAHVGEASENR